MSTLGLLDEDAPIVDIAQGFVVLIATKVRLDTRNKAETIVMARWPVIEIMTPYTRSVPSYERRTWPKMTAISCSERGYRAIHFCSPEHCSRTGR